MYGDPHTSILEDYKCSLSVMQIEICRRVENVLARHDRSGMKLTVLPYHAALSQEARLESMQQFLEAKPNKSLFLVCTDRYVEISHISIC